MTEALSPFVFKKFSLAHLEIDKEITLKFRKATIVDNQYFREQYGKDYMKKDLDDPITVVRMICRFLSKESIKDILKIKFVDIDRETGEEVIATIPLEKKFMMFFPLNDDGQKEVYKLFFSIFGYTKEQIDMVMGVADKAMEKEKKTQKVMDRKNA